MDGHVRTGLLWALLGSWFVLLCCGFGIALGLPACTPRASADARAAHAVGRDANIVLPRLVACYDGEGRAAIDRVASRGGDAREAGEAVAVVAARWAPLWKAWADFQAAHERWADAAEQGSVRGQERDTRAAYCALMGYWPSCVGAEALTRVFGPLVEVCGLLPAGVDSATLRQ